MTCDGITFTYGDPGSTAKIMSSGIVPDRSILFRALQKIVQQFWVVFSSYRRARKNRVWSTSTLLFQVGKHLIISSVFGLSAAPVCFLPFPVILCLSSLRIIFQLAKICLLFDFSKTEIYYEDKRNVESYILRQKKLDLFFRAEVISLRTFFRLFVPSIPLFFLLNHQKR